jgi:hypothetical protein
MNFGKLGSASEREVHKIMATFIFYPLGEGDEVMVIFDFPALGLL